MKILLVHNYYGTSAPSGENRVFDAEKEMLCRHGHVISCFNRHSDHLRAKGIFGVMQGALSTPWNPWSAANISRHIKSFNPDVIHVHNTFPLLSPAIFSACGSAARVLTLHNYRLFCPAAIPMRSGRVCTECLDLQSPLPALRYGCYRNSRIATLPLVMKVSLHTHLGTWKNEVDAFIVLSDFQRDIMIKAGLPREKVHVKPNFYPSNPDPVPWTERQYQVVFAGRLSPEKGIVSLIRAWQLWGESAPELLIIGDGPLRAELEQLVSLHQGSRIRFLGQISPVQTEHYIANAKLLVLPSECFEGFPMVIREAFAYGTPIAVSKIGPLPEIVRHGENGIVFLADDPYSLQQVVSSSWTADGELERLSLGAHKSFKELYNVEVNHHMLMEIYEKARYISRRIKRH